jgi:4-azaleucine resistance transporter AzlC
MMLGVVPFGLIASISAVGAGMSPTQAAAASIIMFAGASQLAAVQLIGAGASAAVVVLTVTVVNLRFLMYSASIAPHFKNLSIKWKLLLAYILTDQAYALSVLRFEQEENMTHKHWYYMGASMVLWTTWQICSLIGIYVGAQVPPSWSLDFAVPLVFMAVVIPAIKDQASAVAALCGGSVAVLAAGLPFNLGLITGAAAGILAGLLVDLRQEGKEESS